MVMEPLKGVPPVEEYHWGREEVLAEAECDMEKVQEQRQALSQFFRVTGDALVELIYKALPRHLHPDVLGAISKVAEHVSANAAGGGDVLRRVKVCVQPKVAVEYIACAARTDEGQRGRCNEGAHSLRRNHV